MDEVKRPDVKAIRKKLGLTQRAFAARFAFVLDTIRDYEQGRSTPIASVRAYLTVIDRDHAAVDRALLSAPVEVDG